MDKIDGLKIPSNFLPLFEWKKDIQYFEGPLLSEYTTNKNETYAFHWCDCSDDLQRWMVVRVSPRSLLELTAGLITIRELLIDRSQDRAPLLIDMNDDDEIIFSQRVQIQDLPVEYLPKKDVFISSELFENYNAKVYPLLLNGDWNSDQLALVQRRFMDTYALLSQHTKRAADTEKKILDFPWKGGFSSLHFYNELKKGIRNFISLRAITYASPGYIEFNADRSISLILKKNVDTYIANKEKTDHIYKNLSNYISEEKFKDTEEKVVLNKKQEETLEKLSIDLLDNYSEPSWDWIREISSDSYKSTQITRSYYRKIKELSGFVEDGRLSFAEI